MMKTMVLQWMIMTMSKNGIKIQFDAVHSCTFLLKSCKKAFPELYGIGKNWILSKNYCKMSADVLQ